jgi:Protein of unknown function DUF262
MKNEPPKSSEIRELVEANDSRAMTVNREYQRGAVWKPAQQKRLIDSVLRGYPLPMIYLLRQRKSFRGETTTKYEVIDGQQRINSMSDFFNNKLKMFDPKLDAKEARFPRFIEGQPCEWGRKRFEALSPELQSRFLGAKIAVVEVEAENDNEARDLFVRLQAGLPLTAQEKRDAWPGQLPLYIARLAGRDTEVGHPFFGLIKRTGGKKAFDDGATPDDARGAYRQLCSGWLMLLMERWSKGPDAFLDVNNKRIDEFYYEHIDFDKTSNEAKRFEGVLQKAYELLFKPRAKRLKPYEALHVLLLVDLLLEGYAPAWESRFEDALDAFRAKLAEATRRWREGEEPGPYWNRFGGFTRASSDRKDSIATRHQFFLSEMYSLLEPESLDKDRLIGGIEKEYIYYRDKMLCQNPNCGSMKVEWSDAEFHHVEGHAGGGKTVAANGALVHRGCHPKTKADVEVFAKSWKSKQ